MFTLPSSAHGGRIPQSASVSAVSNIAAAVPWEGGVLDGAENAGTQLNYPRGDPHVMSEEGRERGYPESR